ncbi:helix-turn-helix transcriptional regulator [Pseudovibrio sp. Alg231-02]|uniref:helix-turn-helix transcriptional regulator n=1 Tax=Pseudovibrio sp. Alg231-02 TaxID=1922223 RepID=UPI000D552DCA|nr:YafY family protein [Pseudovibrio sp. Alg231-02]
MRRTDRLFHIIQILRSSRSPVTGRALADELEISLRTLYRDMAELMAQRVPITGEAGTGYVLDDGYDMPPLMLTADELEAAALGAAWVATQADPALARSARDLVAKLSAAVPPELRPIILDAGLKPIATTPAPDERFDGVILRRAIRDRTKLQLTYKDGSDKPTTRIIWPLLIAYLNKARYIVAWCETREDYRHFRTDRVHSMEVQPDKYPGRRKALIKGWEEAMASKH